MNTYLWQMVCQPLHKCLQWQKISICPQGTCGRQSLRWSLMRLLMILHPFVVPSPWMWAGFGDLLLLKCTVEVLGVTSKIFKEMVVSILRAGMCPLSDCLLWGKPAATSWGKLVGRSKWHNKLRKASSQQPTKSGSRQSNKEQRSMSLTLEGDHP